jgi:O-antigen ligase
VTGQRTDLVGIRPSRLHKIDATALLTLYLFFLIAIPSRLQYSPLGGAGSPTTILGALFLLWYIFCWLHPSSRLDTGPQPMRRAAVLFLCTILATYVSATQHYLPSLELNGADRGLILTCGWVGVLLLAADGIDSAERLRTLLRRVVFGVTSMAALGIVQFRTGLNAANYILIPGLSINQPYTDLLARGDFRRPSATAIHPLEFGFVLAAVLPLAIHQARYAPPGLRVRRWLQVALIAVALPMTVSRSAFVGLAIGLIVILPTWPRRDRWVAYVVMICGLFALRAVIPGLIGTIRNLFLSSSSDSSAQERSAAFTHAGPLISAHPWFGQGFGTFIPHTLFFTDDQFLNSAIEIGLVGLAVLLVLFLTGWRLARRTRRASSDPETRHLAQCLAASAAVMAAGYTTFDAFYFPMAAALTFFLLGCVGAAWRLLPSEADGVVRFGGTAMSHLLALARAGD